MHNCNRQRLYALLEVATLYSLLHWTTIITNFFKHYYFTIALHYYNSWFILTLLQSTIFVCIIAIVNFWMYHFKWQPMYALLYLTTKFACIVAIEESNIKTIRNIDYNMKNLITIIWVVNRLFGTDIVTFRWSRMLELTEKSFRSFLTNHLYMPW